MTEVKALFPIGKTQWRKWTDAQRSVFNALCTQGRPMGAAIRAATEYTPEPPVTQDVEPPLTPVPPKPKAAKPAKAAKPRIQKV
jgi:hypothetical protein